MSIRPFLGRCRQRYLPNLVARVVVGATVRGGPFAGMKYIGTAVGSALPPKLLGTYERELHAIVEQVVNLAPPLIIDVGAAEGYYAVGLALRCPRSRIIAFETLDAGRHALAELAARNGVGERLDIRGACTPAALQEAIGPERPFILADVEGYESRLFADGAPYRHCRLLIELHPHEAPGIESQLTHTFSPTHQVQVVRAGQHRARGWLRSYLEFENRLSPTDWMYLTPREA